MSRNQKRDKAKIVQGLMRMPNVEVICKLAGIPRSTHYRWVSSDLTYANDCKVAIDHSRSMISAVAESHVIEGVKAGDKTYSMFWLRNHHPAYRTRIQLSDEISYREPIPIMDFSNDGSPLDPRFVQVEVMDMDEINKPSRASTKSSSD